MSVPLSVVRSMYPTDIAHAYIGWYRNVPHMIYTTIDDYGDVIITRVEPCYVW